MSDTNIRKSLIRLARTNPEFRGLILPLLRQAKTADDGADFVTLLKKKWRNVKYDAKRGTGTANVGGVEISFQESGNDDAVIVTTKKPLRIKGDPKAVMSALDKIRRSVNDV
jgi:hypothetical protein